MFGQKYIATIIFIISISALACNTNNKNKKQTVPKDTESSSVTNTNSGEVKPIPLVKMDIFAVGKSNFAVRERNKNVSIADTFKYSGNTTYYAVDSLYSEKGKLIVFMLTGAYADNIEKHDWVLVDKSVKEAEIKNALSDNKSHSKFVSEMSDIIVAHTEPVSNMQTITINFTPKTEGRYLYFCSNYEHFQSGMKGYLVVN